MPLLNQSKSVQNLLDQCKLHTKLQNYFTVGGVNNEPGMTIASSVNQMLLAYPNAWKFNRWELSGTAGNFFTTQFGVQDILHAGACCFSLMNQNIANSTYATGGVGIDLAVSPINGGTAGISVSGGVVTVQFLQQHPGFVVGQTVFMTGNTNSAFNSVFTYNGQAQTSTWTNGFVITAVPDQFHIQFAATSAQISAGSSGAPGITNWGWIDSAYLTDFNCLTFPQPVKPIIAVDRLAPTYYPTGDKTISVAMIQDQNNGVLKFRLSEPMGTYNYQMNIVYQARAAKLLDPTSILQWPDNLFFVAVEVALWYAFRFAAGISASETQTQFQAAQHAMMMARVSDDREDTGEAMVPDRSLMSL